MSSRRIIAAALLATWWLAVTPAESLAWGPATHIFLSGSLLAGAAGLAPAVLDLLRSYRSDFYEGSVWADVVVGKRFAEAAAHCHAWPVAQELLDRAATDRQRVFALGYLGHLAADTVAHGHFVPRSLMLSRMPEQFGHLYWELRADGLLKRTWWDQVEIRVAEASEENRTLLEEVLRPPLFSFEVNRVLFESQLASYRLDRWYRLITRVEQYARWPLTGPPMERFHRESIRRMVRIVGDPGSPEVTALDPTGGSRPRASVETRRELRRLIRAGDLSEGVVRRAADRMARGMSLNQRGNDAA
ncbi:MAG: zinc dependent phospholipase C family protein [bacterium]